jgi:hypothetical protein
VAIERWQHLLSEELLGETLAAMIGGPVAKTGSNSRCFDKPGMQIHFCERADRIEFCSCEDKQGEQVGPYTSRTHTLQLLRELSRKRLAALVCMSSDLPVVPDMTIAAAMTRGGG